MDKQRTVHRNLEQLILEMPSYIRKLEEVSDSIDEKIGWKEFKFCFKLATSQIVSIFVFSWTIIYRGANGVHICIEPANFLKFVVSSASCLFLVV